MARKRSLHPEELELWQAVTRTVQPMHLRAPLPPVSDPTAEVRPEPKLVEAKPAEPPFVIAPFTVGARAKTSYNPGVPTPAPIPMDAKAYAKLKGGKLRPEARIDLHGMTLSEAHPELLTFILNSYSSGARLVLVITGKGKAVYEPIPRPIGALRHQVPHWLRLPPLNQVVQHVTEAHLKHGGSGAFYVYLRKTRD